MILHVDMDAFYASVEERERPELRGKPLIVGGSPQGRGVVSAANYAARKFGIHSAMPCAKAVKLCADLQIIRPRMQLYVEVSRQIRDIFARFTPDIEPLSLDEAFLDVRASERLFGSAEEIGRQIKLEIRSQLQLIASVGVAPNKFLAKLASDLEKPDGFTVIPADEVQEILDPLAIKRIWGVGRVTQKKFDSHGIQTFGQLRRLGKDKAQLLFGNVGEHFWLLSQGIDHRRVVSEHVARTISHECTFATDIQSREILLARLMDLTEQVAARVRSRDRRGKTITIKVRYSDFHTITRSQSLARHTNSTDRIWRIARRMFVSDLPDRPLDVRLVGVGLSNFEDEKPRQLMLFGGPDQDGIAHHELDVATDKVRNQFGNAAIRRATALSQEPNNRPKE